MTEQLITLQDIAILSALANGIIPADARDPGAALVHAGAGIAERMRRSPFGPIYRDGLTTARQLAQKEFQKLPQDLTPAQIQTLLQKLLEKSPAFFRTLRADVCALYLSDPAVWQRIGFPGPSADRGGYPDFDQPQT